MKDTKLWAKGKVVTSTPGYGIGVQFIEMAEPEKAQLKRFVDSLIRMPT